MTKQTSEIKRFWHLINLEGQILGRASVGIANILTGKSKVKYLPNLDQGDYVVVVNAERVLVSGRKESEKVYYRYSGYPGGLREERYFQLKARRVEEIVRRAVSGMLPRNKLHRSRMARLFVYPGLEQPHGAQLGGVNG